MTPLRKLLGTAWVAGVLLLAALTPAYGQSASRPADSKLDRAVQQGLQNGTRTQRVIVTVKPGRRDAVGQGLRAKGGLVKSTFAAVDAIAVEATGASILSLANNPDVEFISSDAPVYAGARKVAATGGGASAPAATSILRETLGLAPVPSAAGPTGAGVGVAVIDSGIAPTASLRDRISAFYDFTRGGVATAPYDDFGHGTHVAGLIGGAALYEGAPVGVAPSVRFVGLKVLDANGTGSTSDAISALDFVTRNHRRLGVQIVNLSLGHEIFAPAVLDPLVGAVQRASQAGLLVVVSAGNNGIDAAGTGPGGSSSAVDGPAFSASVTSPGNAPSAITIGASTFGARSGDRQWTTEETARRDDDLVASYSGRGPTWFDAFAKPDVVAPGHFVVSEAAPGSRLCEALSCADGFLRLQGASMSAGVASGVVALAIEAHARAGYRTDLSPNALKAVLEYSAIPLVHGDTDELAQGAGEVNAAGAIALASALNTDVRPGAQWLSTGINSSTIDGTAYAWSQHVIWGDSVLGGSVLDHYTRLWSANIVWGTNIVWSAGRDRIVWDTSGWRAKGAHSRATWLGDNIVWGTAARSRGGHSRLFGQGRSVRGSWGGDNIVWGTLFDDNIVWGTAQNWVPNIPPVRIIGQRVNDNIIWGTWGEGDNIVWGTWADGDNIVWGTFFNDNIIWGTSTGAGTIISVDSIRFAASMARLISAAWGDDNVVWGTWGDDNIVWGTWGDADNIVWGTWGDADNIVWGTWGDADNIVWGTWGEDNIVWGTWGDNIVWGTWGDNIVWGTFGDNGDNVVWGTWGSGDNVVWGTFGLLDNIVWGTAVSGGGF